MAEKILDPGEIVSRCNTQKSQTKSLREKWAKNYKYLTGRYYEGPSEDKGAYALYVSNKPKTFGNKIIDLLAGQDLTLRIPLIKQGKKKRQGISDVEAFGYGIIDLANQRLVNKGEKKINAGLAFNLAMFGAAFVLEYIHKEEDSEGEIVTVADVEVFDPVNSYWFMGSQGFLRFAHSRIANTDSLRDEYGDDAISETDGKGGTLVYTTWDKKYSVVTDGVKILNVKDNTPQGLDHDLGYVPVHWQQCGSIPHIQIEGIDDTIADSFCSIYDNNNQIYDSFSEAMTYGMTMMGKGAKTPYVAMVKGGKLNIQKDFDVQGGMLTLDSEKVVSLQPLIKPEMPQILMAFISLIAREISNGSWADIAFGMFDSAAPVGTTNMMLRTAMSVLIPSQLAMEEANTWICNEGVNQYKKGDFDELELHGTYSSNKTYQVKVSPEKIDDEWVLEAKLHSNLPQDELTNAQVANLLKGHLSEETIQDRLLLVQDTDAEMQKMALERAKANPIFELTEQINALMAEDEKENADVISMLIAMREDVKRQYVQKLLNPQGITQPIPTNQPQTTPALAEQIAPDRNAPNQNLVSTPPPDVAEEIANSQG